MMAWFTADLIWALCLAYWWFRAGWVHGVRMRILHNDMHAYDRLPGFYMMIFQFWRWKY